MLLLAFLTSALIAGLPVFASNLQSKLRGAGITAFFPGDPGYANASKPFNLRFDYEPAVVAFPTTAAQVGELVKAGRAFNLSVTARSGGHSYIANSLGNDRLVVDLSKMKSITITKSKTAIIETGNTLGDVALALNKEGLALPHGSCAYVGIGGHSGHGGFGFSSRLFGLTLDTISEINLVLADGTVTSASKSLNPDLFWALRGSSSSFGIVTSIEVKPFKAPEYAILFQYNWQLNYSMAATALGIFQDYVQSDIPPEFGGELVLTPGNVQGNVSFGLTGSWYGAEGVIEAVLQPLLDKMVTPNSVGFQGNGTWIDNLVILAGGSLDTNTTPDGTDTFYAKSLMVPEAAPIDEPARLAFMKYLANEGFNTTTGWFLQIELYGGSNSAINAVPLDRTAFAHRSSMFTMQFYASAPGNIPPYPESGFTLINGMVNSITSNMPADWDYGAYINYIDDELVDWQKRYYGPHYSLLKELKRRWDSHDVFFFPDSIEE
ncbi:glucooligosaccharide oxidase [Mycena floridula]|nr:glucooligosaccharide oxidase [Mycena floridula]